MAAKNKEEGIANTVLPSSPLLSNSACCTQDCLSEKVSAALAVKLKKDAEAEEVPYVVMLAAEEEIISSRLPNHSDKVRWPLGYFYEGARCPGVGHHFQVHCQ